jgi:hypothetical protein
MLVCGLILAAMVTSRPAPMHLAFTSSIAALLTSAPSSCVVPFVDDMICVRAAG